MEKIDLRSSEKRMATHRSRSGEQHLQALRLSAGRVSALRELDQSSGPGRGSGRDPGRHPLPEEGAEATCK